MTGSFKMSGWSATSSDAVGGPDPGIDMRAATDVDPDYYYAPRRYAYAPAYAYGGPYWGGPYWGGPYWGGPYWGGPGISFGFGFGPRWGW